jgi:hypothetical protein
MCMMQILETIPLVCWTLLAQSSEQTPFTFCAWVGFSLRTLLKVVGFLRVLWFTPRVLWFTPRVLWFTPRVLWFTPRVLWFTPRVLWFAPRVLCFAPTRKVDRVGQEKQLRINNCGDYFVLVLCTQVNMMFVMLLWVCIHTGQAEKLAWPRWESNPRPFNFTFLIRKYGIRSTQYLIVKRIWSYPKNWRITLFWHRLKSVDIIEMITYEIILKQLFASDSVVIVKWKVRLCLCPYSPIIT